MQDRRCIHVNVFFFGLCFSALPVGHPMLHSVQTIGQRAGGRTVRYSDVHRVGNFASHQFDVNQRLNQNWGMHQLDGRCYDQSKPYAIPQYVGIKRDVYTEPSSRFVGVHRAYVNDECQHTKQRKSGGLQIDSTVVPTYVLQPQISLPRIQQRRSRFCC